MYDCVRDSRVRPLLAFNLLLYLVENGFSVRTRDVK